MTTDHQALWSADQGDSGAAPETQVAVTEIRLRNARASQAADASGNALVSLYRVAPGKHLDFLKCMADREAVDREADVPATQWYMHTNGDSWDSIPIAPVLSDAQQEKADAIAKKKGLKTSLQSSLEFRQFMSMQTDSFVDCPTSATQLVQQAQGK